MREEERFDTQTQKRMADRQTEDEKAKEQKDSTEQHVYHEKKRKKASERRRSVALSGHSSLTRYNVAVQ